MNKPLWTPSPERVAAAQVTAFRHEINKRHNLRLADYPALYAWSVENRAAFWSAVWDFCAVVSETRGETVVSDGDHFQHARWFPQARLNFAENLLQRRDDRPALVSLLENGERRSLSYAELQQRVAQVAAALRGHGVKAGDRVAGFMPNIMETAVAMLAAASIGAVWSSCSPDFGVNGVLDRFGQIAPRVLFAADGYYYNGKPCDSLERLAAIVKRIDSVERVVLTPVLGGKTDLSAIRAAVWFDDFAAAAPAPRPAIIESAFTRLPFDHPLYIMYSSGTTGKPKCIVHGAGGTLLQHLKEHRLHVDLRPEDVFFYFTTCGWMMWNWLVSGLATGATVLLYDGSPLARDGDALPDAIDSERISVFGVGARYLTALEKAGKRPRRTHDLASLKTILSTGSPLSRAGFDYVYRDIKPDVCLSSISGGTDILSCFVGGCPALPVHAGEIQARGLGMAVEFWNEQGRAAAVGEKGELVCVKPFPSTPVGFWDDPDGEKYRNAYFARWPGVWAHGDYGELTAAGGVVIHGRSDAALNPGGVRIGTAEIYRQVEILPQVRECLAIGQEWEGDARVVLFVVLGEGVALDDELVAAIKHAIRRGATARHVPAKIVQVADIPRTISGKIVELAVRDIVHGRAVSNTDALANPEALELFRDLPELRS